MLNSSVMEHLIIGKMSSRNAGLESHQFSISKIDSNRLSVPRSIPKTMSMQPLPSGCINYINESMQLIMG